MANVENRYTENALGRFYVDDQCIDCDQCRDIAPDIFKRDDVTGHSYVFRQPENPDEEAMCLEAMENCPVEAIGENGL